MEKWNIRCPISGPEIGRSVYNQKNFGFGCMRLPMQGENVDIPETKRMVDAFWEAGFNYFNTAHGYLQGKSETALKESSPAATPGTATS